MNIQPLRDNVVVKADKDDGKVKGFLVVREWEKLPHTGEITAVGPLAKDVAIGDRVHFNRYAYQKIDEDLFIGLERNITAII